MAGIGAIAGIFMGAACILGAEEMKAGTTIENLQSAYGGESSAKARYEAFAAKADEEGCKSVAALFRATSESEGIHATKHAAAIKKLGAEPRADVRKADVKTTKENLEAALKGETAEKDSMYPAFIKQAESDKDSAAVKTFKGAMAAEIEHAKLYKQALNELDSWKAAGKEFLVCTVCGWTTMDSATKKCPVCASPRSKFDAIK
jgi:rubrerythrin